MTRFGHFGVYGVIVWTPPPTYLYKSEIVSLTMLCRHRYSVKSQVNKLCLHIFVFSALSKNIFKNGMFMLNKLVYNIQVPSNSFHSSMVINVNKQQHKIIKPPKPKTELINLSTGKKVEQPRNVNITITFIYLKNKKDTQEQTQKLILCRLSKLTTVKVEIFAHFAAKWSGAKIKPRKYYVKMCVCVCKLVVRKIKNRRSSSV